jgi:hypothetical protein
VVIRDPNYYKNINHDAIAESAKLAKGLEDYEVQPSTYGNTMVDLQQQLKRAVDREIEEKEQRKAEVEREIEEKRKEKAEIRAEKQREETALELTRRPGNVPDEAERLICVHDHFLGLTLREISKKRNIQMIALKAFTERNWWHQELNNLKRESALKTKTKLNRIMNVTLEQLEDRVINGDVNVDRDGNQFRIPVSAQTLSTITNIIFEKKNKLDLQPDGVVSSETKRLMDLAAALSNIGSNPREIIDVEVDGEIYVQED